MPFTAAQLHHFEARLHQERERLLSQLRAFEDGESAGDNQDQSGDLSKFPTHAADLGTDVVAEEVEVSIGTRVSAELAEIEAAFERLHTSPESFGLDEQTGEPIPYERLDLIPYARVNVPASATR